MNLKNYCLNNLKDRLGPAGHEENFKRKYRSSVYCAHQIKVHRIQGRTPRLSSQRVYSIPNKTFRMVDQLDTDIVSITLCDRISRNFLATMPIVAPRKWTSGMSDGLLFSWIANTTGTHLLYHKSGRSGRDDSGRRLEAAWRQPDISSLSCSLQ